MRINMTDGQQEIWNEGFEHHPDDLGLCPYPVGTASYTIFEDGWWAANNEY